MVSVVIPALNEEKNLKLAVDNVLAAARAAGNVPVELIVVDDGSTDGTAAVIAELQKELPVLRAIHHDRNLGIGTSFLEALGLARHDYITFFPSDNVLTTRTLRDLLSNAGKAEFVCAYTVNREGRSRLRNFLSSLFTFIYTATFNINLIYIHATPVYPVARLRGMSLRCRRYSFPSEITVKLLRQGCTYLEVPGYMNPVSRGSSALSLVNLFEVVGNYLSLVWEIYFSSRAVYAHSSRRIMPDGF